MAGDKGMDGEDRDGRIRMGSEDARRYTHLYIR